MVLSIGLLGLAGLQVSGMKSNHDAYLRTQATFLGYDIADRMRANPAVVYSATASYNVNKNVTPYVVDVPAATANCTTIAGCITTEMANTDINQWRVNLATQLPDGVGVICLDSTPDDGNSNTAASCDGTGSIIAIKIWWNDARDGSGKLKRFIVNYQP